MRLFAPHVKHWLQSPAACMKNEKNKLMIHNEIQDVFYTSPFAVAHHEIILDDNKPVDYRFLDANPAFEKLTGLSVANIIGRTVCEVMPGIEQSEFDWIAFYGKIAIELGNESFEQYSEPLKKWYEVHAYSTKRGYFTTIFIDITDRIKTEQALRKSQEKLRELNHTKDQLFSIIAHDLKTPFSSIIGISKLLQEKMREKGYNDIEKYAIVIEKSSRQAMDLLSNLLEWSRAQTGRMEFSPECFVLRDFIKENLLAFDEISKQKSIVINKDLPHNVMVSADKQMLSTVLRNLISNALKFTREGGEVVISAQHNPEDILVSIQDNGIGIAPEMTEALFRINTNVSTPGTNNEKGTGLGLILCKEFVAKHGGRIWVESEEGKGSTFSFTLPRNTDQE